MLYVSSKHSGCFVAMYSIKGNLLVPVQHRMLLPGAPVFTQAMDDFVCWKPCMMHHHERYTNEADRHLQAETSYSRYIQAHTELEAQTVAFSIASSAALISSSVAPSRCCTCPYPKIFERYTAQQSPGRTSIDLSSCNASPSLL